MTQFSDLSEFLDKAWSLLRRGVVDPKSAARNPTFSTISEEGFPTMRTVVLRRADPTSNCLEIHTDLKTNKVSSLKKKKIAGLHFWIPKAKFQIRVLVEVDIFTGSEVKDEWNKIPVNSRISYGCSPKSGTKIEEPFAYKKLSLQENFAVLRCIIKEFDVLYLGAQHQRAKFEKINNWRGHWLAP
jgi:pyridoxine/pyridoxamine 5'-phosphate oxidase